MVAALATLSECMQVPRLIQENNQIATYSSLCGARAGFAAASTNIKKEQLDCIKCWTLVAATAQLALLMEFSSENGYHEPVFANTCGFLSGYCAGYVAKKLKDKLFGIGRQPDTSRSGPQPERGASITPGTANSKCDLDDEATNPQSPEGVVRNLLDRDELRARFQDP